MTRIVLALVVLLALAGAVFGAGYLLAFYEVPPFHGLVNRVDNKVQRLLNPPETPGGQQGLFVETVFFDLDGTVVRLPRAEGNYATGGGMAVWGDELVVVTKEGEVFAITKEAEVAKVPLTLPDNGFEAYRAALQRPEYAGYTFNPRSFRYNDIMVDDGGATRTVYLSSTYYHADEECYGTRLWRLRLAVQSPIAETRVASEDWQVLYDTQPCLVFNSEGPAIDGIRAGGRMTIGPNGMLYLSSGDYAQDGLQVDSTIALDPETDYGKILEIDPEMGEGRVFSMGHRNPGGLVFDDEDRLWAIEHGERGGDELNWIRDGLDYGWPHVTLGTGYNGMPLEGVEEPGRHTLYEPPIFAWLPSVGMTALTYIEGFDDRWDGDLLAGSLSSPEFGHRLFRVRIQDGRALLAEEIKVGDRVRYVTQFGPDIIAVMRDDSRVILFRKSERADHMAELETVLAAEYEPETAAAIHATVETCNECHSMVTQAHRAGPTLEGVLGRPVAATTFEGYSEALRAHGGIWTEERLRAFLEDTEGEVPGTAMPAVDLAPELANGVIRSLRFFEEFSSRQVGYD